MSRPSDSRSDWRRVCLAAFIGAVLGVVVLHPATMWLEWLELRAHQAGAWGSLRHFLADRMSLAFMVEMLPMSFLFAVIGACTGALYVAVDARLRRADRR